MRKTGICSQIGQARTAEAGPDQTVHTQTYLRCRELENRVFRDEGRSSQAPTLRVVWASASREMAARPITTARTAAFMVIYPAPPWTLTFFFARIPPSNVRAPLRVQLVLWHLNTSTFAGKEKFGSTEEPGGIDETAVRRRRSRGSCSDLSGLWQIGKCVASVRTGVAGQI